MEYLRWHSVGFAESPAHHNHSLAPDPYDTIESSQNQPVAREATRCTAKFVDG
jgi:hypothetical protein